MLCSGVVQIEGRQGAVDTCSRNDARSLPSMRAEPLTSSGHLAHVVVDKRSSHLIANRTVHGREAAQQSAEYSLRTTIRF